jgi:hypothetical protein
LVVSCHAVDGRNASRLFIVKDTQAGDKGAAVKEVLDVQRSHLLSEQIALLDTGEAVFIWVGGKVSDEDKSEVPEIAEEYLAASGHSSGTRVTMVCQQRPFLWVDVQVPMHGLSYNVCRLILVPNMHIISSDAAILKPQRGSMCLCSALLTQVHVPPLQLLWPPV